MKKTNENLLFLGLLVPVFALGFLTFLKPEKLISMSENRTLATFSHFTVGDFIEGTYQNNLENALSDQFPLSERIRVAYSSIINNLPSIDVSGLICKNHYLELSNSVDRRRATFDCDDHIVYLPERPTEEETAIIDDNIEKYNQLNALTDAYYYVVNDSSVFDFENNNKVVDYSSILKSKLTGNYHIGEFNIDSYDTFANYFYKTDHHWNYVGSYQGYLDIVDLLGAEKPLALTATMSNHENFFGSHAQNTKNYSIEEEFTFYTFDLPPYTTKVNGDVDTYGHLEDYLEHNYEYSNKTNYYAYFYGDDEGELVYDFAQPEKGNLLIISNSFSNAVNNLIASHFNKTYVIDLRHYKTIFGKDFVLSDYLKSNKIDKTLLIINPTFIRQADTNQGLES